MAQSDFIIDFSDVYAFEWQMLWYPQYEINIGVSAFRLLIKNQETSLLQTRKNFHKAVRTDATLKSLPDQDKGSYYSHFFESEKMAISELQRLQRYSLCLSIFSFFEGRLKAICDTVQEKFKLKPAPKKVKVEPKSDLGRMYAYLTKVYGMNTGDVQVHFDTIVAEKDIRNIIAHHDGFASSDKYSKLTLTTGLNVTAHEKGYLIEIVDIIYLESLLVQIEAFFKQLLRSVDRRYKELNETMRRNKAQNSPSQLQ